MSTLEEYQRGMPEMLKKKHHAMTKAEACQAAKDLRHESLKCAHFGNGGDAFDQMSDNLNTRARYFELLAASKQ